MGRSKVIGVYPICNTGAVLVHEIGDEKVLASINGNDPVWYDLAEEEEGLGFSLGPFFVPLDQVMRAYGGLNEENSRT